MVGREIGLLKQDKKKERGREGGNVDHRIVTYYYLRGECI
jgi:hypothetical protein